MQQEIEVKFLEVEHEALRVKLKKIGAIQTRQLQTMRRAIIDYPDKRLQKETPNGWGWVRIRDEGDKITCTYKHIATDGKDTTHEIEYDVSSYEKSVELFETIGLVVHAEQETKREVWEINSVEIMLDEWPWLPPYIEIEGPSEQEIRGIAEDLGFTWSDAVTGSSDRVYRMYYPKMTESESITDAGKLTFAGGLPVWLKARQ